MDLIADLNSNSGSLTAIASILLAIITAYYAKTVRDQTKFMKNQSDVIRDGIKREQLIRKYERLSKEMDDITGPLFSKIDDSTAPFFTVVAHSQEGAPFFQDIFAFWRDIKKNIYLAPRDLKDSLTVYLDARQEYRKVRKNMTAPGEDITAIRAIFDRSFEELKPKIQERYEELSKQLEACEKELEILS